MMNMFMAKFAHAAAGCRKVVLLSAVAAMALGAQAYTYTFSLEVYNLPATYHTSYYLRDTEKNEILAYATANDLSYYKSGTTEDPHRDTFLHNAEAAAGDSSFVNPNNATIVEHTLTDISSTGGVALGNRDYWKLTVLFTSDKMLPSDYSMGYSSPLQIVAFNEAGDAIGGIGGQGAVGYIQTQPIGEVGGEFSASFNYNSVPEPTSGVLLLLGMAGLALKNEKTDCDDCGCLDGSFCAGGVYICLLGRCL